MCPAFRALDDWQQGMADSVREAEAERRELAALAEAQWIRWLGR